MGGSKAISLPMMRVAPTLADVLCASCRGPLGVLATKVPFGRIAFQVAGKGVLGEKGRYVTIPSRGTRATAIATARVGGKITERLTRCQCAMGTLPSPAPCVLYASRGKEAMRCQKGIPVGGQLMSGVARLKTSVDSNPGTGCRVDDFRVMLVGKDDGTMASVPGAKGGFSTERVRLVERLRGKSGFCVASVIIANPKGGGGRVTSVGIMLVWRGRSGCVKVRAGRVSH